MPVRPIPTLVLLMGTLVGCGATRHVDPTPAPEVTATGAPVRLVDEAEADLVLIISNQSLDDDEARLSVRVDGVTVVEGDLHAEDQHNWIRFPLALPPGRHDVTAESDSGATLHERFELPHNSQRRYAVIEHWTEDDSPDTDDPAVDLTWQFLARAPAFG